MKNRTIKIMLMDALASISTLYLSFLIRFDFSIPSEFLLIFFDWVPWFVLLQTSVFYFSGLQSRMWRYTSLFDLYAIMSSVTLVSAISVIFVFISTGASGYPRSVLLMYYLLNAITTVGIRLSVRVYYTHYHQDSLLKNPNKKTKKLLLIGAGGTGEKIAREIRTVSRHQYSLVGFVDDNVEKHGALLHGKEIFCSINDLPNLNIKYDELLITAPSASGDRMRRIVEICKRTGKRYKIVPAINEIINGEISMAAIRDVSYSDLLGRDEVVLDMNSIEDILKGKRVLITGAGGSIGSELVKQCLSYNPAEIICLDMNEEAIYKLDQFFSKVQSKTILKTVLASVIIKKECDKIFSENQPHVVFHAAAYKHVPMQEYFPWEAVKTNVYGTSNVSDISIKYDVDKFVLVSTDKAVKPVNVMGATKRLAEIITQNYNNLNNHTEFMAVRFGNVLGSSGSVIPIFQEQIKKGGPITITDPEMERYFMSIPEASQLILQAGSLGVGGEVFILDMGQPIKIIDIANELIRLSGYEPELDIPIKFTGTRHGEKKIEELSLHNEKLDKTKHDKIFVLNNLDINEEKISKVILGIEKLKIGLSGKTANQVRAILSSILPEYKPDLATKEPVYLKLKAEA